MQNPFQSTLQNIKNRVGRGAVQENFSLGAGAILVPKQIEIPTFNANITINIFPPVFKFFISLFSLN